MEGSILDDDRVVEGMERLVRIVSSFFCCLVFIMRCTITYAHCPSIALLQMKEGAQVEEQITKSAEVMVEVEHAISKFEPFSLICKQLFVLFAGMREIDFLYEFTAQSFMSMLQCVLKSNTIEGSAEEGQRLASLKTQLHQRLLQELAED